MFDEADKLQIIYNLEELLIEEKTVTYQKHHFKCIIIPPEQCKPCAYSGQVYAGLSFFKNIWKQVSFEIHNHNNLARN